MRIRRFRHPLVAGLGAFFLSFLGYADALGTGWCVHHASHPPVSEGEAGREAAHHGHHQDGSATPSHATVGTEHHVGAHHATDADPHGAGSGAEECDCGAFCCVGMSGPPGVSTVAEDPTDGGGTQATLRLSSDQDVDPVGPIPYLLPFPNGPPLRA